MNLEEITKIVQENLSEKRFYHSICVMERCIEFAEIHGEDVEKAKLIGIAHDIAKEIPKELRIKTAEEYGVELDEFEKQNLSLIHAKLGAKMCAELFGFTEDMCDAIKAHTTAKFNMSKLDKILYLADYSEASREFKEANEAYELGKKDLDEGYFLALKGKIEFMRKEKIDIHHNSIDAYNSFLKEKR